MNGPTLQVQMLGQFTLRYGDRTISDSDDRSRRVWSLLAYMLYNHGRSFAQEELIHLYWSNGEKSADPGNALKSIFHRIRTALDKLQPGLGRLLIRRKAGRYALPRSLAYHWKYCRCLLLFSAVFPASVLDLRLYRRDWRHRCRFFREIRLAGCVQHVRCARYCNQRIRTQKRGRSACRAECVRRGLCAAVLPDSPPHFCPLGALCELSKQLFCANARNSCFFFCAYCKPFLQNQLTLQ